MISAVEAAVKTTLRNVGATDVDKNGYILNANGMLVDWLNGERDSTWIGSEGIVIDNLRDRVRELENRLWIADIKILIPKLALSDGDIDKAEEAVNA